MDIRKKYYMAVSCPECGYRNKGVYKLDLIDGPQERECVRTEEGRGLCGAKWSIAAEPDQIQKMNELLMAHEILQVAKERFERLDKEI